MYTLFATKKTNSNNEDVYSDLMSSEWARKTLEDIRKIDPNGLLVPISLYADGVSIGMNGKANLIPVMMTLGWYSRELFKQDGYWFHRQINKYF